MPITVELQTESGEEIESVIGEPGSSINDVLPASNDESFAYLRFIDRYGNTTFNNLQMRPFLMEWRRLYDLVTSPDRLQLLRDVEDLATKCQKGIHLYLKFIGD
ncbi:MAG TPA: hypothetical protein VI759_11095 [Dehalococcoidia bacterium]|nr:hypothetical protein [Dehalococcoidia bacterium]